MSTPSVSPLSSRRIVAFVGPFGTGKTEIAISYSLASIAAGRDTSLADLDVVTPYFRVGDYHDQLEARGLRIIAAPGALASFENPALPPEIVGALDDKDSYVVLDVGGDAVGARLLGVFADHIADQAYDLWLVVNPFRPSSSSASVLADQRQLIEASSRLRVGGVVANPHLGKQTEPPHLASGWREVSRIADELGLPIVFLAVAEQLLVHAPRVEVPILGLHLTLRLPWEPRAGTVNPPAK